MIFAWETTLHVSDAASVHLEREVSIVGEQEQEEETSEDS